MSRHSWLTSVPQGDFLEGFGFGRAKITAACSWRPLLPYTRRLCLDGLRLAMNTRCMGRLLPCSVCRRFPRRPYKKSHNKRGNKSELSVVARCHAQRQRAASFRHTSIGRVALLTRRHATRRPQSAHVQRRGRWRFTAINHRPEGCPWRAVVGGEGGGGVAVGTSGRALRAYGGTETDGFRKCKSRKSGLRYGEPLWAGFGGARMLNEGKSHDADRWGSFVIKTKANDDGKNNTKQQKQKKQKQKMKVKKTKPNKKQTTKTHTTQQKRAGGREGRHQG